MRGRRRSGDENRTMMRSAGGFVRWWCGGGWAAEVADRGGGPWRRV